MFREDDAMDEWIGLGKPISRRAAIWLSATPRKLGIALPRRPVDRLAPTRRRATFTSPPTPGSHFFYIITVAHAVHISSSASLPWSPRCSTSAPHASSPRAKSGSTPPSGTGTRWARSGYVSSSAGMYGILPVNIFARHFVWDVIRRLPRYFGAWSWSSCLSRRIQLCLCLAAVLSPAFACAAHAQGCAQCRDNLQATPLPVQQAYRHAIELLAISGLAIFAGGVLLSCAATVSTCPPTDAHFVIPLSEVEGGSASRQPDVLDHNRGSAKQFPRQKTWVTSESLIAQNPRLSW